MRRSIKPIDKEDKENLEDFEAVEARRLNQPPSMQPHSCAIDLTAKLVEASLTALPSSSDDEPGGGRASISMQPVSVMCEPEPATAGGAKPLVLGDKGQFVLDGRIASKLYPHQIDGVKWLWSLHEMSSAQQRGGILGDDMGLGEVKGLLSLTNTN